MSDPDAIVALGRLLTGTEANELATLYAEGATLSQALQVVAPARRSQVRVALEEAGVTPSRLSVALGTLYAICGATSRRTTNTPMWTLPGHLADYGNLTSSLQDLVLAARTSVMSSTYNFQTSSSLWTALAELASRGNVDLRLYMDAEAASREHRRWRTPTCEEVAAQLTGAKVFRTRRIGGRWVLNHAKFLVVDHRFVVITSANFSISAEQFNVELGLRLDDIPLANRIEQQMLDIEPLLYESVTRIT